MPATPNDELGELMSKRYELLVRQLADELQRERGYKAEIARRLGIHPSYVTRVERGGQTVSGRTIEEAMRRLRLRGAFFTDGSLSEPYYREYVKRATGPVGAAHIGVSVDPDRRERELWHVHELHRLANKALEAADGGRGSHDWHGHAQDAAVALLRLQAVAGALRVIAMPEDSVHDTDEMQVARQFAADALQLAASIALGARAMEAYSDLDDRPPLLNVEEDS